MPPVCCLDWIGRWWGHGGSVSVISYSIAMLTLKDKLEKNRTSSNDANRRLFRHQHSYKKLWLPLTKVAVTPPKSMPLS